MDDWVEEHYLETVRHYLKTVPVPFLSFDNYPVIMQDGNRVLREAWYHNLEDIHTAANEVRIPIWGFVMSKALDSTPRPTLADLCLQHFSNLVYGAVAFQYFTNKGRQYIAFVNHSCTAETTLEIEFATEAMHVAKDGTETSVAPSYTIEAGDIKIFTWNLTPTHSPEREIQ